MKSSTAPARTSPEAAAGGGLIFFGTPEFALPTLAALAVAGRTPSRVVSQPPRRSGRGQRLRQPPVARWALEHGVPLSQPPRLSRVFIDELREERPRVAVVVAFGKIFPGRLLRLPAQGCVNLHGSLLPAYRGAAPIQAAIAAGEKVTGVTTMLMEKGLDSGPILLAREVEIGPRETAGELAPRLAQVGAGLVVETLDKLDAGTLEPRPQDDAQATYAPMLTKEDGRVDWRRPARAIADALRAYTPWPGLTATLGGRAVKLVSCKPIERPAPDGAPPGSTVGLEEDHLLVACGEGSLLAIERLQRPGRKALTGATFANGERLAAGELFG